MKRTSTEAHVYMRRHQGANVEHFDVSNVIYHKFSHGAVSYTLNGENINVMLELLKKQFIYQRIKGSRIVRNGPETSLRSVNEIHLNGSTLAGGGGGVVVGSWVDRFTNRRIA